MIVPTDRISGAIAALERGEQVDWRKLADLQALDLAVVQQKFTEDAIQYNEQQTDLAKQALGAT